MRKSATLFENNGSSLLALAFAACLAATGLVQAQPSGLKYDTLLELKDPNVSPMPYHSSDGILRWNFVIRNDGAIDIPAGTRFSINLEIPGRLKTIYFDTRPGLPSTVPSQLYWQCDAPYDPPYANSQYHEWGGPGKKHAAQIPDKFNCHFLTDVPVPPGKEVRHLYLLTDGGYPSSTPVCARSSTWSKVGGKWLKNGDPVKQGSNLKCFKKPAGANPSVDFNDLQLQLGMSGVGSAWQTWTPNIANIGTNPIPITSSVITGDKPLSGFEYKSFIPPGASLKELRVTRGWECRIQSNPPKQVGPFPASGRISLQGPDQIFDTMALGLGTTGSTLLCTYATEHEFGSQAKLSAAFSDPVYYVTTNWPMSHPTKCSTVTSIHGSGSTPPSEPLSKLTNNRSCVNVSTGQPTQCPATCSPLW
jgi:hypothetical protein